MDLKKLNVVELNAQEVKETEGGIAPLILVGWGIMIACSAVALGMKEALNEHNQKK